MSLKRGSHINRLEALSDAVFAFAATLLVVSLEVPHTFAELAAELKGFLAFGVCFGVLILIWSIHNAYFRRYGLHDRQTVFINAVLLFVVLFYVYPLKFIVEAWIGASIDPSANVGGIESFDDLAALFMLYSAGFVAIFACISAMYRHAHARRGELGLDPLERHEARMLCRHYLIFVVVGLISIILAWLKIGLAYGAPGFVYMLLGPLCYLHGWRSEKRWRTSGGEGKHSN